MLNSFFRGHVLYVMRWDFETVIVGAFLFGVSLFRDVCNSILVLLPKLVFNSVKMV